MNLFTNLSRKTVAKRFALLFLTLFAFGFKANAQIPTFNEILKKYYNTDNLVVRTTAQTPPYGQQFQNYTFEEWETVSGSSVEPKNWNSFMTATGSLAGSAEDQISKSTEKRPGTSGTYSARIFSKRIFIVNANGNMTTGRIYAGSMTANNDGNYNLTIRDDSNFNTPLTTIPDSLTVWVAFKPKSASKGNARITTTIHGDTDLMQLAKSGDSPATMVCATANQEIAATSTSAVVWKRVTIPFTAGSHNDPRYILTTFNTNKTPGGGSAGDELYVDDICLIYNPTLEMDYLAQTEYQYSGNGVTMNIDVPFALSGSMSVYNLNKADNVVIAQLSDANGSFANPIELGRITTNVSGTIAGVIPADLPAGEGYKVRVVSTNYPLVSNETNVTISYPYVANPQVEIALGNIAAKSASVTFTPNSDCAKYYYMIAPATQAVAAADVKANNQVKTSSFTATFENLMSNTAYKVYALPLTSEDVEGEMAVATLTTNALVPQITLAQGEVATKSATATFTPNADCAKYYYLIALATETVDAAYVKANGQAKSGSSTETFENLISNTNYRVYALPIDVENKAGELKSLAIKTQAFVPQIDLVRNDYAAKSITATFTPNADCAEYYFLISKETVDAAYIKANGEKQTETLTKTFEGLTSNTAYTIYALPVDIDGFNGEIKTISVTTKALVPHVAIAQGEVATKSAAATFTPNADCVEYYFLIAKATETVDAAYVKENGVAKTETFATTFEDLISNTDYVIYALPIDVEGTAGALATLAVKTQAFTPQVDIERGNFAAKSITATFTPNADCAEYYFVIATSAETVDATYIKENGEAKTEAFTTTFENLTSNTAYTIYALPVDVDGFNGEIKAVNVTTKALVPQVAIAQGEVATKSAAATFTPNADCVEYYFLIAKATETVDAAYVKENGVAKTETFATTFEDLISNTDYVIYALPIDVEGTEGALATLAVKTQAFAPQVDVERGNVAAKSITATFTPNADCAEYYFIIATDDVVDAAYIKANGEKQTETFAKTFENLTSSTAYTIYALPVDVDGFNGAIKSVTITTNALVPQVEILKGDVLTYSISASFTQNADCAKYYVLIAEATETVDAAYVKENGEEQTAETTILWEELLPNTNYAIYALPIDVEGNEGTLNSLVIKTKVEAGVSEVDLEVEKLSETSVTLTATPNENTVLYHYIVMTKAEADAMGEDAVMQKLNENENYLTAADVYTMTVESNVAYYVVAQGKNADGKWGEVTKLEFTVAGPAAVEIAVEKVTETTVTVTATPNENAVSYEYIVIEKAEADAMDEAALMQKLAEANDLNGIDVWTYTVKSNVEYYVIAQAKNAGARTGEMTKVEFIVAGPATVAVAVEKLNETTVSVAATPNENAVSYSYIIIAKAEADAMTESELKQMISESENTFETANTTEYTVESNVAYYVIAQAVNADDMSGVMTKVEFTVAGPAAVEIAVEKVTETTVTVTATPNANAVSYHYIVIEKAEADAMDADALVQKLEEANELNSVDVWTYTVKSNVEYYVVAQAKNADGRTGEMTKVEFIVAGPATVEIAVEETSETSVAITATPNENAVAYHYIVITKAEADAMDDAALMQKLNENEDYLEGVNTTEVTIESNVAYYVVAKAKNADGKFGVVTKVEFMVEVAGPATVAIEVKETSKTTVTVTATPNENAVAYHYILIEKAEAEEIGEDAVMQRLNENETYLNGVDVCDWTIKSNVEYYVVAQAKNADDKWGEVTKVKFMVKEAGPATVVIAVEEVSKTSVAITATPNENAVAYHYIVITKAEADAMDADALMQKLNENEDYLEGVNTTEVTVESNVEYYVVAQAKNEDGVWGEVVKVEFIIIDENAGEDDGDDDGDSLSELETVFEVYPNPASEYVRIKSNIDIESLMIFSIDGKLVYSEDVNQEETMIDVTGFAKGSYIVRMVSNDSFVFRRIVVK